MLYMSMVEVWCPSHLLLHYHHHHNSHAQTTNLHINSRNTAEKGIVGWIFSRLCLHRIPSDIVSMWHFLSVLCVDLDGITHSSVVIHAHYSAIFATWHNFLTTYTMQLCVILRNNLHVLHLIPVFVQLVRLVELYTFQNTWLYLNNYTTPSPSSRQTKLAAIVSVISGTECTLLVLDILSYSLMGLSSVPPAWPVLLHIITTYVTMETVNYYDLLILICLYICNLKISEL